MKEKTYCTIEFEERNGKKAFITIGQTRQNGRVLLVSDMNEVLHSYQLSTEQARLLGKLLDAAAEEVEKDLEK